MLQTILNAEIAAAEQLAETEAEMSFSQRLSEAGTTTLMGMVAVFAVLTIIMVIVMIMGKIVGGSAAKKKAAEAESPVAVPAPVETPVEEAADEEEIAAAITAAISAYLAAEEGYTGGFRVVSFRKASTKPSWNQQ